MFYKLVLCSFRKCSYAWLRLALSRLGIVWVIGFAFLLRTSAIQVNLMALGLSSAEAIFYLSCSRFLFFKHEHSVLCKWLKSKKILCERWKSDQATPSREPSSFGAASGEAKPCLDYPESWQSKAKPSELEWPRREGARRSQADTPWKKIIY